MKDSWKAGCALTLCAALLACSSDDTEADSTPGDGGARQDGAGGGGNGINGGGSGGASGSGGMSGSGGSAGSGGTVGPFDAGPSACTGDDGTGWDPSFQQLECELIDLINERRVMGATCETETFPPRPAMSASDELTERARSHSEDMVLHDYFGFIESDGSEPEQWAFGGTGRGAVSIAAGQTNAASVMNELMSNPGNCRNVMFDGASIGVGYFRSDSSIADAGAGPGPDGGNDGGSTEEAGVISEAGAAPPMAPHWTIIFGP